MQCGGRISGGVARTVLAELALVLVDLLLGETAVGLDVELAEELVGRARVREGCSHDGRLCV